MITCKLPLGKKYSAADLHVIRVEARNEGRSDIICSLVADGDLVPEKGAEKLGVSVELLQAMLDHTQKEFEPEETGQ